MTALSPFRILALLCCGTIAFGVAGCGQKVVPVTGKVVLPASVTLEKDDFLAVNLIPTATGVTTGAAGTVNPSDLTFTLASGESNGVPPGSYKVAVRCQPYAGQPDSAKRKQILDESFGAFSLDKTPLTVEITGSGPLTIVVDLDKRTVTK